MTNFIVVMWVSEIGRVIFVKIMQCTHIALPAQVKGLVVEMSLGKTLLRVRFPTVTAVGDVDFYCLSELEYADSS